MIDIGKAVRKCLEIAREPGPIDLRGRHVPLKPRQYLTVKASAILQRAFLELRVQLGWDVLERQCEHGVWYGTEMEPFKNRSGCVARQPRCGHTAGTCGVCQSRNQCHQGTVTAQPI